MLAHLCHRPSSKEHGGGGFCRFPPPFLPSQPPCEVGQRETDGPHIHLQREPQVPGEAQSFPAFPFSYRNRPRRGEEAGGLQRPGGSQCSLTPRQGWPAADSPAGTRRRGPSPASARGRAASPGPRDPLGAERGAGKGVSPAQDLLGPSGDPESEKPRAPLKERRGHAISPPPHNHPAR